MAHASTTVNESAGGQIRTASGINAILGAWLIVAAFVVAESQSAYWNDLVVGILVLILAATRLSKPTAGTKPASWTNAGIGVWLIAAPFVLGYVADGERWNDIIVGILLLAFGAWSASLPRTADLSRTNVDRTGTTTTRTRTEPRDRTVTGTGADTRSKDRF